MSFLAPHRLALLALLVGCSNIDDTNFGNGSKADSGSDNGGDSGDSAGDSGDSAGDSGDSGSGDSGDSGGGDSGDSGGDSGTDETFDEPGDVVTFADDGSGVVGVELRDESGDSNRDQEFYMLLVNTESAPAGYRLRYYPSADASRPPPPSGPELPMHPIEPVQERVIDPTWRPSTPPPPPLESVDIGSAQQEFLVRNDLTDAELYDTVSATLWALGENVAIWVDDDVPIDWDFDCDGAIDVPDQYEAFGFNNCDLNQVADIVDDNIIPNLRGYFGEESDINGDGRVAVVISPVLNVITLTSESENDHYRVLSSYTEPAVDLQEFDYRTNPGSDEQEVVYVYAPDPYGFFNPYATPEVDTFTGYQLAGEVARGMTALISYNQHVFEGGGSVEEDWVNDAMGTLAADLCGFGAAYHVDAWEYLDAPNLSPLVLTGTSSDLGQLSRGAQYTFARWLYDRAEAASAGSGVPLLTDIMQSGDTGVDSVESATGEDFGDLVIAWQVALLTQGITNADGDPIVDASDWPSFSEPETVSAPPDAPGDYYGANGYQRGVAIHGTNRGFAGGTTDSPYEIVNARVLMENQDPFIYTPGFEYNGYVKQGYSVDVVRLTGITYDEALMQLQATGTGLIGAVVRWNDPTRANYTVEDIFSVTDANAIALPTFPGDYSKIYGVGQLSGTADVQVIDPDGDTTTESAIDTDRWMLDLSARSGTVNVAVWLDRHYSNTSGASGPRDPWVAVVPEEYLPVPTVSGTRSNSACTGAPYFLFPMSLLENLYAQQVLSNVMWSGTEDTLRIPGDVTSPDCTQDWDLDGIADEDEPLPETLLGQIRVQQATINGNVPPAQWYDESWMDADELDDDERYSRILADNVGGRSGTEGEEGFVSLSLEGGRRYILVVGDSGADEGTYEIAVRELQ